MNEAVYLAAAAVLLLLGLLASKISTRFGVPALLLFLGVGMLAGSEGLGGIEFDDFELAQSVSVVALAFILYAGGLDTQWSEVRSLLGPGLSLAGLGTLLTAGIVGVAAAWILDLPILPALLFGAIVSSTDAAAVFSILRSRSVGLKGQLRPLLELESGTNDPMAVFLTIAVLDLITEP
ncbi:MAG TPA: cation:proton antiporter, partial [Acidimicrobiia bacterium]|nr:cation:proton antiporter [Acidimicrobiia bacterium]